MREEVHLAALASGRAGHTAVAALGSGGSGGGGVESGYPGGAKQARSESAAVYLESGLYGPENVRAEAPKSGSESKCDGNDGDDDCEGDADGDLCWIGGTRHPQS